MPGVQSWKKNRMFWSLNPPSGCWIQETKSCPMFTCGSWGQWAANLLGGTSGYSYFQGQAGSQLETRQTRPSNPAPTESPTSNLPGAVLPKTAFPCRRSGGVSSKTGGNITSGHHCHTTDLKGQVGSDRSTPGPGAYGLWVPDPRFCPC